MTRLLSSTPRRRLSLCAAGALVALLGLADARAEEVRQVLPGGQPPVQPAQLTRETTQAQAAALAGEKTPDEIAATACESSGDASITPRGS